jgi:voltage-gated potassium channel
VTTEAASARPWTWARGPGLALALLALVTAAGTAGYVLVEGWGVWDAFYMTVTTVATVGFREVHPLSHAGQVLTVLLIIGGVGTAIYTGTLLVTVIVEGGLHRHVEQRRMARMLDHIHDHFILCGFGRIGATIAEELHQQNIPFVVIERDAARIGPVTDRGWLAIAADASREHVLVAAGIHRARGLIAAVGTDAENVYAVLTARVIRPDLFIVARVESDDAEHKLRRAGADRVISPYQIGASHMAQTALRPAVVDFIKLATSSEHLELSMEQVHIAHESALVGQSIVEASIRQKFGVIIVAIKRAGGAMEFNPPPEAVIQAGDQLVVLGRPDSVKALEQVVLA